MNQHAIRIRAALVAVLGVVLVACGADELPGAGTNTTEAAGAGLGSVCPNPVIVQTDWFPEAEHGATYELVGGDYAVDVENQRVTGSLVASGLDTGVGIEVRTGGPAIGYQPVSTQMYTEPEIHIGFVSTDEAVMFADDAPTVAVIAPLEKNPQIIMWDPETYPEAKTIADLGELGVTVNVFAGSTFVDVLVAQGILQADQVDPSYDGSPGRFIASRGEIAQQGFASAEPYTYEFVFQEWGKPVEFQLIHDAGFQIYGQALAVRAAGLDTFRPCLERLVPIMQQAAVDYARDPSRVNAMIVDVVDRYDSFWVYEQGVAEYSVATQLELGLVGDGPDSTLGNMDPTRVQAVIDAMVSAGMNVRDGLSAADISTNEFIDPAIGLGD
ncbi:MAG TPA: ABC transporter substrate-binding protein [Acidimicrobiia bacterium]|nr:ABC transporter substrate-binding protein [Acidimicrobiia bacterium]